ncbi:MAG: rhodanese-like domain-containing protein, partial [Acidimicrobiales bacterium]
MSAPEISIDKLAAARADGPVPLVDVRQPEEYEAAHVPGAK